MNTVYIIFNKSQLVVFYGLHMAEFCVIMHLNGQMSLFGGSSNMDYVYAVTNGAELSEYQAYARRIHVQLSEYLRFLECTYQVTELPGCIVLTSAEIATKRISSIPLPAYTNEFRTVFCPDITVWKGIYLRQLDCGQMPEIRHYYKTQLTENNVLQILGHEFVHHSNLFIDEAYEQAQWFEEGMCEYISRKYFLTAEEFKAESRINSQLVKAFEDRCGVQSLEDFRAEVYSGNHAGIFFYYWKSFLAIQSIAERFRGDILAVFKEYRRWFHTAPSLPLSHWFSL